MIYAYVAAALTAGAIAGAAGWNARGWKAEADAAKIVSALHATAAAQRANADAAAGNFEQERARLAGRRTVITKEVDRVVSRDVYRLGACIDADGLRIAAAAIAGAADPGQPAPALPGAPAPD